MNSPTIISHPTTYSYTVMLIVWKDNLLIDRQEEEKRSDAGITLD